MEPEPDITDALRAWREGVSGADQRLMALIYPTLHRIASQRLALEHRSPLQATELVNEAYLKLVEQHGTRWRNRNHFYAVTSMLIRRILVDQARHQAREKRGGNAPVVTLDERVHGDFGRQPDWLALDQCLTALAEIDEAAVRIVELRFFAGLGIDAAAETLSISRSTAIRKWRFAREYLKANW